MLPSDSVFYLGNNRLKCWWLPNNFLINCVKGINIPALKPGKRHHFRPSKLPLVWTFSEPWAYPFAWALWHQWWTSSQQQHVSGYSRFHSTQSRVGHHFHSQVQYISRGKTPHQPFAQPCPREPPLLGSFSPPRVMRLSVLCLVGLWLLVCLLLPSFQQVVCPSLPLVQLVAVLPAPSQYKIKLTATDILHFTVLLSVQTIYESSY